MILSTQCASMLNDIYASWSKQNPTVAPSGIEQAILSWIKESLDCHDEQAFATFIVSSSCIPPWPVKVDTPSKGFKKKNYIKTQFESTKKHQKLLHRISKSGAAELILMEELRQNHVDEILKKLPQAGFYIFLMVEGYSQLKFFLKHGHSQVHAEVRAQLRLTDYFNEAHLFSWTTGVFEAFSSQRGKSLRYGVSFKKGGDKTQLYEVILSQRNKFLRDFDTYLLFRQATHDFHISMCKEMFELTNQYPRSVLQSLPLADKSTNGDISYVDRIAMPSDVREMAERIKDDDVLKSLVKEIQILKRSYAESQELLNNFISLDKRILNEVTEALDRLVPGVNGEQRIALFIARYGSVMTEVGNAQECLVELASLSDCTFFAAALVLCPALLTVDNFWKGFRILQSQPELRFLSRKAIEQGQDAHPRVWLNICSYIFQKGYTFERLHVPLKRYLSSCSKIKPKRKQKVRNGVVERGKQKTYHQLYAESLKISSAELSRILKVLKENCIPQYILKEICLSETQCENFLTHVQLFGREPVFQHMMYSRRIRERYVKELVNNPECLAELITSLKEQSFANPYKEVSRWATEESSLNQELHYYVSNKPKRYITLLRGVYRRIFIFGGLFTGERVHTVSTLFPALDIRFSNSIVGYQSEAAIGTDDLVIWCTDYNSHHGKLDFRRMKSITQRVGAEFHMIESSSRAVFEHDLFPALTRVNEKHTRSVS